MISHAKHIFDCSVLAIAVVINRLNMSSVTVGVDGTLFRHHPKFKKNLTRTLSRLVLRTVTIEFEQNFICICFFLASFGFIGRWFIKRFRSSGRSRPTYERGNSIFIIMSIQFFCTFIRHFHSYFLAYSFFTVMFSSFSIDSIPPLSYYRICLF